MCRPFDAAVLGNSVRALVGGLCGATVGPMTVSRRHLYERGWAESRRHGAGAGDQVAPGATRRRGRPGLFGLGDEPLVVSDNAVVSPALRREADDLLEFPSVGDWVVVRPGAGPEGADLIESVLERRSIFVRRWTSKDRSAVHRGLMRRR